LDVAVHRYLANKPCIIFPVESLTPHFGFGIILSLLPFFVSGEIPTIPVGSHVRRYREFMINNFLFCGQESPCHLSFFKTRFYTLLAS